MFSGNAYRQVQIRNEVLMMSAGTIRSIHARSAHRAGWTLDRVHETTCSSLNSTTERWKTCLKSACCVNSTVNVRGIIRICCCGTARSAIDRYFLPVGPTAANPRQQTLLCIIFVMAAVLINAWAGNYFADEYTAGLNIWNCITPGIENLTACKK